MSDDRERTTVRFILVRGLWMLFLDLVVMGWVF